VLPRLTLVFTLLVALLGGCARHRPATVVPAGANAVVERTVDGDTIRVRTAAGRRERVRLIGIDTPETKDPRRPVQCFGEEASAYTARLLPPGTAVRLERDVELRDRYGRLLAYVYRARDGTFVNLVLAREGYARPLTIPPNVAHVDEVVSATRQAREEGRGLWNACNSDEPP
jgi:micrococcal nuclease